ncbi:bile acid-CoA:amino acid N-acyltransferase-like [Halichoeres trimaculatus]|uniref:bile acid-CoA:amino acid N-acyltransferase-like n=1 Tax=Halichoeres trimaculatus TaxID=147232 RepID=UPI003D9EAFE6
MVLKLHWAISYNPVHYLFLALGGALWMSSSRPAPLLTASPVRALIDEQINIRGCFLPPNRPVTVCTQMLCEDGDLWESFSHYVAKEDGTIDMTRDNSVGGSFLGCEPMGLFWSLQPAPGEREGLRLRKTNVETPYVVHVSLLEGHVSPSKGQSTELAEVSAERWYMAPGVQRVQIRQDGVVGTLFLPPGPGPFPAILDLWGMGGGLVEYRSALLASRGYVSLSLAYIGHEDLPGPKHRVNVGDSYFKAAFQLLRDHHQVCADRVGIIGLCFGGLLALRIATQLGLKPACLIFINSPVGSTFTFPDGVGEEENSAQVYWTYDSPDQVTFKSVFLPANMSPESKLKIEDLECPMMYIMSQDDQSVPSKENADLIEKTLKAAGKSHLFTCLSYPGAGHLIEPPYAPNARRPLFKVKPRKCKPNLYAEWGGHCAPHAAAQEDSWRKILTFLERHLR